MRTWERYHSQTMSEYAKGYAHGTEWAQADRRDGEPGAFWIETFRDEARSDSRWARAFYLGALRGYRSVSRTLKAGRWGL